MWEIVLFSLKFFESNISDKPPDFESDILEACIKGKLTSVQYLVERYYRTVPIKAINNASSSGNLDLVKYLNETCHAKLPYNDDAISKASSSGNLDVKRGEKRDFLFLRYSNLAENLR